MADARDLLEQYGREVQTFSGDGRSYFAPKVFDALRAVLDLHWQTGPPESRYCACECHDWPCATVRAISKALEGP